MSARLPWLYGNCTRTAEAELFQAVVSAPRAPCSQKQTAARCSARQAVVATSAAELSMLTLGKRTTFWRTALAARTQSIIIFRPHSICNHYRWHYDAEEFQWILKLGVLLRTQIERGTTIGQEVGQKFCDHELRRAGRRKPAPSKE